MTGKEQIDNIAEQLKFLAEHNPCGWAMMLWD